MTDEEFNHLLVEDGSGEFELPVQYRNFAHTTLDLTFELENLEYIKGLRD